MLSNARIKGIIVAATLSVGTLGLATSAQAGDAGGGPLCTVIGGGAPWGMYTGLVVQNGHWVGTGVGWLPMSGSKFRVHNFLSDDWAYGHADISYPTDGFYKSYNLSC